MISELLLRTSGNEFVGLDNYERLFRGRHHLHGDQEQRPLGADRPCRGDRGRPVFAVLTERVRWSVAFKIAVFMPLAVSLFAVGVIWRIMYQQDPDRGAHQRGIVAVPDSFVNDRGVLSQAKPVQRRARGRHAQGFMLKETVPGRRRRPRPHSHATPEIPADGRPTPSSPSRSQGGITGVVWRDFKPGGGTPGRGRVATSPAFPA